MKHIKTIIIGGGPAGSVAGILLLKKGEDCCIIEKNTFPRNKTCAGLLTKKTIDLIAQLDLGIELEKFYLRAIDQIEILDKSKRVVKFSCTQKMFLTERHLFDELLVNAFKKMNGLILENETVVDIDSNKKIITTTKQRIKYEYLICADGCRSISNRLIKKKTRFGMGIEADIPINEIRFESDTIGLDLGLKMDGYCWIFPKKDYVNIGFCCSYDKNKNYLTVFKSILHSYGVRDDLEVKYKGATFPFERHDGALVFAEGSILLAGDAAGMTDCLTGEGIYFAVKSGCHAASAISESSSNEEVSERYQQNCREIIDITNRSFNVNSFLCNYRRIIIKMIKGKEKKLARFCDSEISLYKYGYDYNLKSMLTSLKEK